MMHCYRSNCPTVYEYGYNQISLHVHASAIIIIQKCNHKTPKRAILYYEYCAVYATSVKLQKL